MEVRRMLWLPLDDLPVVVRKFLNPKVSRSGLARCLARYQLNRSLVENKDAPVPVKSFKDYAPGFLHVDTKYLPQMADETARPYLFVAMARGHLVDRATRWMFLRIYADQSEISGTDFLRRLKVMAPMKIEKVHTEREACPRGTTAVNLPTASLAKPRSPPATTSSTRSVRCRASIIA